MNGTEIITTTFETEEAAARFNSELTALGSNGKIVKRENLDGNAVTWIVVANVAVTTLPKILDGVAKVVEAFKARTIRIGDREIRNPTSADVRALNKRSS